MFIRLVTYLRLLFFERCPEYRKPTRKVDTELHCRTRTVQPKFIEWFWFIVESADSLTIFTDLYWWLKTQYSTFKNVKILAKFALYGGGFWPQVHVTFKWPLDAEWAFQMLNFLMRLGRRIDCDSNGSKFIKAHLSPCLGCREMSMVKNWNFIHKMEISFIYFYFFSLPHILLEL